MEEVYYINKQNYISLFSYSMNGGRPTIKSKDFKSSKKVSKRKSRNKKISRKAISDTEPSKSEVLDPGLTNDLEPLSLVDWISYVEKNNLQLKMDDLKKMYPGNSIKIISSIIQTNAEKTHKNWKQGDIINAVAYFTNDVVTFTHPNILNGHKYGKSQFDPTYDPNEIEPFDDDGDGNAVLGSGGDISILVSKLIDLPDIIVDLN
jgi:hypothetical protein